MAVSLLHQSSRWCVGSPKNGETEALLATSRIERAQKSSRDHPSVPPTRASGPFSRVPFETAVSSLLSRPKSDERRARARTLHQNSRFTSQSFLERIFPKRNLKKDARNLPPTRRRDLHFHHSRTTAFRRARTKAKNGKREKKGCSCKSVPW